MEQFSGTSGSALVAFTVPVSGGGALFVEKFVSGVQFCRVKLGMTLLHALIDPNTFQLKSGQPTCNVP